MERKQIFLRFSLAKEEVIYYHNKSISTRYTRVLINLKKYLINRRLFHLLRPLGDRIVIELIEVEEKSAFGIVLPDSAKEKPQEGKVVAVGTGRILENGQRVELDVKVDDRIIFSKYSGTEVKYEGNEYLILRESDVLAIIQ